MTSQEFASLWIEDRLNQFHFAQNLLREAFSLGWPSTHALETKLIFNSPIEGRITQNSTLAFLMVPYINATVIEARKSFEFFGFKADSDSQKLIQIDSKARGKKGKRSDDLHLEDFGFPRPTIADIEFALQHTHCGDLHAPVVRVLLYGDKGLAHWTKNPPGLEIPTDFSITMNVILEMFRIYFYTPASIPFPRPKFCGFQILEPEA